MSTRLPRCRCSGARFLLIDQQSTECHPLRTGINTIGRFANNDIVFEGSGICRRHYVILIHVRGGCRVHDTASRNGTFVNGQRVGSSVELRSGDLIRLSQRHFFLVSIENFRGNEDAVEGEVTVME